MEEKNKRIEYHFLALQQSLNELEAAVLETDSIPSKISLEIGKSMKEYEQLVYHLGLFDNEKS